MLPGAVLGLATLSHIVPGADVPGTLLGTQVGHKSGKLRPAVPILVVFLLLVHVLVAIPPVVVILLERPLGPRVISPIVGIILWRIPILDPGIIPLSLDHLLCSLFNLFERQ